MERLQEDVVPLATSLMSRCRWADGLNFGSAQPLTGLCQAMENLSDHIQWSFLALWFYACCLIFLFPLFEPVFPYLMSWIWKLVHLERVFNVYLIFKAFFFSWLTDKSVIPRALITFPFPFLSLVSYEAVTIIPSILTSQFVHWLFPDFCQVTVHQQVVLHPFQMRVCDFLCSHFPKL